MNSENMTFTVVNDSGKEIQCEVLFTFKNNEMDKSYVVYTDNALDEAGNTKVYASVCDLETDESILLPIETEKEWKIIEDILEKLQSEILYKDE